MPARRHHYLSECYLKGFTDDGTKDGKLFAINMHDGSTFTPTPGNVGVERDFNAVEGQPKDELENALAEVEAEIAPCLERIIHSQSIVDENDWEMFLNLIAMFASHNPRMRSTLGGFMTRIFDMIMEVATSTPERWASQVKQMQKAGVMKGEPAVTYEKLKQALKNKDVVLGPSRGSLIALEIGAIQRVLETMANRTWSLLIAKDGGTFITSDDPVCLTDDKGQLGSLLNPIGHGVEGSVVTIPISKGLAAIGTFGGEAKVMHLNRVAIGRVNDTVARFSGKQIYAADKDFPIWIGRNYKANGEMLAAYLANLPPTAAEEQ